MIMLAIVQEVRPNRLIVRDRTTFQRIIVNTTDTRCIFAGDLVSILYNGVMTSSIPPQIFGIRVRRVFPNRVCR